MDNQKENSGSHRILERTKKKDNYHTTLAESVQGISETSLMFLQSTSVCSLPVFEQHSRYDDHSSIVSDFRPKASSLGDAVKSTYQNKQQNIVLNEYFQNHNIFQEKLQLSNSLQYDTAFKKPHFLKHSIFEDNIASFKDESSPNCQLTAASSLSSLTIEDDDDYDDNSLPNKAGLIKQKLNVLNSVVTQKSLVQEYPREDPIGSTCEPKRELTFKGTKELDCYQKKLLATIKQNKNVYTEFNDEQFWKQREKRIHGSELKNENGIKTTELNQITNQYFNNGRKIYAQLDNDPDEALFNSGLHINSVERNKIKNVQNTSLFIKDKRIDSDILHNYSNKSNRIFTDQSQNSYRFCNELNNSDEYHDLNAYEEQLLDQCIRRGMAKVTKKNINEIKPFCWDLNQICLTTRAMLKIRDEELMKKRKEKCNNRYISQEIRHLK